MRISAVRPLQFTTPDGRSYLLVKIETNEGRSGLGEFGATFQELAGRGALEHAAGALIGRDPFDTEAIWQELWRRDFHPGGLIAAAAISAIDLALWDLKGQALGQPVWRLLGGRVRDCVETYEAIGGGTVDAVVSRSCERVAAGCRHLRFGLADAIEGTFVPGEAMARTVEQVAAVRSAVGPEIGLIVDVHTRLDPPEAVRLGRALEPYGLEFLEDPLRSEHLEGYRQLRRQLAVPLAAGEQLGTKWAFRALLEEELVDFLRIDLCNVGGVTEARKVAGWGEVRHQQVVPHNPLSPVSSAACLHFAIATPNATLQEAGRTVGGFLADLFPVQPAFPTGAWPAPTAPGLGVAVDEAVLARYPFRDGACPAYRRRDGSFTNW
jgi:L-alanine-DL-glutamate epimerase-like enolase superfamily enzyme